MKTLPDFRSAAFLREHLLATMAFYDGRCVDETGGFFQFFKDDGSVYDRRTRHLVSSTRFVVTHAWALRHFPEHPRAGAWREAMLHGLDFLERWHRQPGGGYAWVLQFEDGRAHVEDGTLHCYGHAFVLLAYAEALRSGHAPARAGLDETFALMERRFWEPAHALYADEAAPDWQLAPYRGQNANMHACEAMLAAFEATGEARFLERAETLAQSVTQRLAALAGGLVWEHYRIDAASGQWTPDWDYNRHDKTNIFRPWGFQTGHLTEWAKLLLTLERLTPGLDDDNWRVHRARELFHAGTLHGWDRKHGGLAYGFAEDAHHPSRYAVCDGDKYHWVQAESLAAAAVLAARTGEGGYWDWYDRIWAYVWQHFVDHHHGAWFRILGPDNHKLGDEKSPAGKVDYHDMGACYEAIAALARAGL